QTTSTGDLPETSHPGFHAEDFEGIRPIIGVQFEAGDRTRSHERHLSAGDVIQLRNLIERVAPADRGECAADSCVPLALLDWHRIEDILDQNEALPAYFFSPHRAEFQHWQF